MSTRPSTVTPSSGCSKSSNEGDNHSGVWKLTPSSPPVMWLSCEASVRKPDATASVIIAKKIAFTRRLKRPMASDSSSESNNAAPSPTSIELAPAPRRLLAIATP